MLNEIIAKRRSIRMLDPDREVEHDKILSILKAIQWAPSSRNVQPWKYIVMDERTPKAKEKLISTMMDVNQIWAKNASVLFLSLAMIEKDGEPYINAYHDLGLANENLTLQVISLGLNTTPIGGFDKEKVKELFNIPSDFTPLVIYPVGYPGKLEDQDEYVIGRETKERTRKEINEIAFLGDLNTPFNS